MVELDSCSWGNLGCVAKHFLVAVPVGLFSVIIYQRFSRHRRHIYLTSDYEKNSTEQNDWGPLTQERCPLGVRGDFWLVPG